MSYLHDPEAGMTIIHGSASDPVVLLIDEINAMPREIYDALVECAAFVNWRNLDVGEPAILVLAFYRTPELKPDGSPR